MWSSEFYLNCALRTYDDAARHFEKARSKVKGRPLKRWARLTQEGNDYIVSCSGTPILKFTPDNKLVFLIDGKVGSRYSTTISQSLHRAVPVMWIRAGTGRYRVKHLKIIDKVSNDTMPADKANRWSNVLWMSAWKQMKTAPELFMGMTFDLNTGECINARKDIKDSVIPDKRTAWLRKLRMFKRNVKLRARMGVFDSLIKQIIEDRKSSPAKMPDWTSEPWLDALYNAIRDEECPTELLRGFVASVPYAPWRQSALTTDIVLKVIDDVLKTLSIELRRKFGVFDESTIGEVA